MKSRPRVPIRKAWLVLLAGLSLQVQADRPAGHALPDLIPQLAIPSHLYIGKPFMVRVTNHNIGLGDAGRHKISVMLVVSPGSRGIRLSFPYISAGPLRKGGRQRLTQTVSLRGNMFPGTYKICVKTDIMDEVRERSETNNTACQRFVAKRFSSNQRQPDLVARINRIAKLSERVFRVFYAVQNKTSARAGSHVVRMYLDSAGQLIPLTTIPSGALLGNMNRGAAYTLRMPDKLRQGRYRFCVRVDASDTVREANENNNDNCRIILLSGIARADLKSSISHVGAVRRWSYMAVNFRISNVGRKPSKSSRAIITIQRNRGVSERPVRIGRIFIGKLRPAASRTFRRQFRLPMRYQRPGNYLVCVIADGDNRITESDERNNRACAVPRIRADLPRVPIEHRGAPRYQGR